MPTVIILTDASIRDYYEQIQYSLDQRFHNYQPHFQEYPISESEYGELDTFSSYADHANDIFYNNGTHIERIVK